MTDIGILFEKEETTYSFQHKVEYCATNEGEQFQDIIGANGKIHDQVEEATGTRRPEITNGQNGKVSYFMYAQDGIVEYNGVVFTCDYEKNQLCLGDTSNPKNCITIPLSKGGSLVVNRDNIMDLGDAIGMFSPEDVNRILRAIAQDKQAHDKLDEMEADKSDVVEESPLQQLREQIELMREKLENGDVESTFQIGAQSYTLKEWDKMLEKFDRVQDALKEEREAAKKEAEKESEEENKLETKNIVLSEVELGSLVADRSY